MRQKILIVGLLLLLAGIIGASFVSTAIADGPNRDRNNPVFCQGDLEFVYDGQALDDNVAPCGSTPDSFRVILLAPWVGNTFNPDYKVEHTWREAVRYLHSNGYPNGSMWVVKRGQSYSQSTQGVNVYGLCEGKAGLRFGPDHPLPTLPPCNNGVWVLIDPWSDTIAQGQTSRYTNFDSFLLEAKRWKGGSMWFEPAQAQSQVQPTAPFTSNVEQAQQAQVNWGPVCANVESLAFSNANAVQNINTLAQLNPPCGAGVWWVNAPWRPGCEGADVQAFLRNPNCNYPYQYGFNNWGNANSGAIGWLHANNWPEGSFWFEANSRVTSGEPTLRCNKEGPLVKICDRPFQLLGGTTEGGFSVPAVQPTVAPLVPTSAPQPLPAQPTNVPTNVPSNPTGTSVPGPTGTSVPGPTGTPVPPDEKQNPPPVVGGGIWDYGWVLACCLGVLLLLVLGYIGYRFLKGRGSDEDDEEQTQAPATRTTTTTTTTTNPLTIGANTPLPNATVNVVYDLSLAISGGTAPIRLSLVGNPTWLNVSPSGHLVGTPTVAGTHQFEVIAIDAVGTLTHKRFDLTVV